MLPVVLFYMPLNLLSVLKESFLMQLKSKNILYLTLTTLQADSADDKLMIFFLFFLDKENA